MLRNALPCVTAHCRALINIFLFLGLDSLEHSLFPWTSKILNFWNRSHTKLAGKQTALGKLILNEKEIPCKLGGWSVFSQESELTSATDKAHSKNKTDSKVLFFFCLGTDYLLMFVAEFHFSSCSADWLCVLLFFSVTLVCLSARICQQGLRINFGNSKSLLS